MSLVQDFELATKNVQNPNAKIRREAEVILKNFTNHPDALNVCKQLLENSTDSNVQFHAATTIKEIVTRNSFKQALDERKNWVHYLIEYSINRYANILHHVRGAILQTIAISTKLSWLDSNDLIKVDVMNTISNLMANPTYVSRKLGLAFLSAILIEFESTKASSIGLSLDFHHSCQTSFQKSHMIPIFQMVLQCLHDNVQSRSNPNASGNTPHQIEELIGSSLHCADKILCWDYSTNATSLFKNKDEIYLDNQTPSLKLSIEWKNVLLTPEVLHLFFQLSAIYFNEPAMCSRPIKCLTQLAGVHGSVFETEEVQRSYITTYMAGFKVYLSNVFQAISTSNSPIDMADKIFGLSQIAKQLFRRTSFKLLCSIPDILCVLRDLGSVAILCLKLKPENEDDTWFLDATDDMLLMWASFVEKLEAFSAIEIQEMLSNPEISAVMTLIAQVSSEISKIYIDTHVLLIPIKPDDEDSFEYEQKDLDICSDQLLNIGVLARVQPTDILIQLINLINEKHQQLKNLLAIPSNTDVLDLQEQIHWAVIISGHILADSGIGETPMIPRKILEVSAGSQQGSDPVTTLPSIILSILGTLTVSSDSIEYQNCSPLLLDSLLWFVERWSASYLFAQPSDYSNLSLSLQQSFGEAAGGCQVLDYLLVNIELQSKNWIAEIDIMSQIIIVLQGLSKNRAALNLMVQNAAFSRIVEFLLFNTAKLPASTHSPIVQMIAFVATRATDPTVKSNYFKCLSDAIENSLNSILHHPEFSKNHQHTLTREQIIISLEMFDGLALSIEDETTVLIFETIGRNFNSFIKLLDIYHEFPNMEVYILQIFKNLIRLQNFDTLTVQHQAILHQSVHDLIQTYAKHEVGRHRKVNSEEEEELFEDLCILLQTLSGLISCEYEGYERDTVLARKQNNQGEVDVSKVVFVGVNSLLPLITKPMLEFPKLCSEYMTLVSLLIEYFPDRLSQLPSSLLDSLIQSLLFGTQQNFSGISDISFKAIQSLALYAWAESMMTQNDMSYLTTSIDGMLQQIMHALLYQPLDSSILNDAANAIFALSLCKPELFFNILNSILNQHQMIDIINKLYENFSNLSTIQKQKLFDGKFSIGWGSPGLERLPSLNSFRKLFITFVMDSRTTVIIK